MAKCEGCGWLGDVALHQSLHEKSCKTCPCAKAAAPDALTGERRGCSWCNDTGEVGPPDDRFECPCSAAWHKSAKAKVHRLEQELRAAVARAEKLSNTLCANNTEAAGIKIERDTARGDASRLRREVAALNEKLDAACPQRCAKCDNTATGLVSHWCARCWRAAYDEEATKNVFQRGIIESTNRELHRIDTILAGRPALNKPTRAENIEHAIATAAKCDAALARVDQLAAVLECVRGAWPNGVGAPIMGRIMSLLAETKVTRG